VLCRERDRRSVLRYLTDQDLEKIGVSLRAPEDIRGTRP
jgi:hypothetical protein